MTTAERQRFINSLAAEEIEMLLADWPVWARRKQLPPAGDWRVWLLLAGRGFGKTRTGSEWVRSLATNAGATNARRRHGLTGQIGLVGDTFDDVRHVMVEGPAGILANSPKWARPDWQPSQRRLIWPNGVTARCFSADDPEQLRGPEFEFVWADEIAKWRHQAAWDNLMLALRIGNAPRALATTTPRPLRWLADLAEADDTALVQGRTVENQVNLSPSYLAAMHARYGGGWLARQELDAVLSLAAPDALFQRDMLAAIRRYPPPRKNFVRVVIGVDLAVGGGDETGIVIVGKTAEGDLWVLADDSLRASPDRWMHQTISSFRCWQADTIIVEVNQGGDLVRTLLIQHQQRLPVRLVRAHRSKTVRAEPVAAEDWQAAAAEALASKWAGQVPRRAAELARLLRG
jgi:phage terminase large subunit-like protein